MHLARVLTFEGGDEVDQLVRSVAAGRVAVRPVDHFLQDEMPGRVAGEVGDPEQPAEIVDVAVQVAGDEDLGGALQRDETAAAAGRGAEGVGGSLEGRQKAVGVGHGKIIVRVPRRPDKRKAGASPGTPERVRSRASPL